MHRAHVGPAGALSKAALQAWLQSRPGHDVSWCLNPDDAYEVA